MSIDTQVSTPADTPQLQDVKTLIEALQGLTEEGRLFLLRALQPPPSQEVIDADYELVTELPLVLGLWLYDELPNDARWRFVVNHGDSMKELMEIMVNYDVEKQAYELRTKKYLSHGIKRRKKPSQHLPEHVSLIHTFNEGQVVAIPQKPDTDPRHNPRLRYRYGVRITNGRIQILRVKGSETT